ncbi:hypothetical protein GGTG_14026 [Gaeumannomyces tritici R3-111a-1]|uniref:Uncharacterized protein n=1 Tax=Gaeumannomyces tritici (strain R3-111a-1) TaxID=644352 RepID=J3PKH0_GAET3|nr:hypothetical protein GGTG_14026 [Gaeumannomyces tritici R3-111a-1]EJT68397.1 hypothetical protein GGTG_14026 [Gaeumannomyces tritici R3-111a-1]
MTAYVLRRLSSPLIASGLRRLAIGRAKVACTSIVKSDTSVQQQRCAFPTTPAAYMIRFSAFRAPGYCCCLHIALPRHCRNTRANRSNVGIQTLGSAPSFDALLYPTIESPDVLDETLFALTYLGTSVATYLDGGARSGKGDRHARQMQTTVAWTPSTRKEGLTAVGQVAIRSEPLRRARERPSPRLMCHEQSGLRALDGDQVQIQAHRA